MAAIVLALLLVTVTVGLVVSSRSPPARAKGLRNKKQQNDQARRTGSNAGSSESHPTARAQSASSAPGPSAAPVQAVRSGVPGEASDAPAEGSALRVGLLAFRAGPPPTEGTVPYLTTLVRVAYPNREIKVAVWRIIGVAESVNEDSAFDLYNKLRRQGVVPHLGWKADQQFAMTDGEGQRVAALMFEKVEDEASDAFIVKEKGEDKAPGIKTALTPAAPSAASQVTEVVSTGKLLMDGLYQSAEGSSSAYLRFYADNTVISVGSTGKPSDLALWFYKDNPKVSKGIYALKGTSISFTTTSSAGSVEYSGTVGVDSLTLNSHSLIVTVHGGYGSRDGAS